jgi:hypothetical protein
MDTPVVAAVFADDGNSQGRFWKYSVDCRDLRMSFAAAYGVPKTCAHALACLRICGEGGRGPIKGDACRHRGIGLIVMAGIVA